MAQDSHTRSSNGLSMLCLTFTAPCYILKRNGGGLPPPPPPRVHTHQNLIQAGIREFPGEHLYLVERGAESSLLPWGWMRGGHLMGGISNTHTAAAGTQATSLMPMVSLHCHLASHVIPLSLTHPMSLPSHSHPMLLTRPHQFEYELRTLMSFSGTFINFLISRKSSLSSVLTSPLGNCDR